MLGTEIFRSEVLSETITRIWMPGNVFAYLVRGTDRAAVIDTGCGLGPFRRYAEDLLGGLPYDLILTHGHVDHAGGAAEFDKAWLHPRDVPVAAAHTDKAIRKSFLVRQYPDLTEEDMPPRMTEGYAPLSYGQTFPLGGETLEIVCLGGHTPGSVGILFRQARILLAGDACCSFTLLFGGEQDSLPVAEYKKNLEDTWAQYRDSFDTMLYSHPHNYGGPEVMAQMIDLCAEILAGRDDRIPSQGLFGTRSFTAKAVNEQNRRKDGLIANLQYGESKI